MSDFKKLDVWKKAYNLSLEVYKTTKNFPSDETFGLTSQIRRASVSISTNIAEGNGRIYSKEYIKFLSIARGSTMEVENLLMLSRDLGYINDETFIKLDKECRNIINMLYKLIKSVKKGNQNNNYIKEENFLIE
ncbi:four helix bundle protein [Thermohalobacter berrensis]|uniref:Four helix bundle protein n=1 Tax=Thermohalobacter berrensis TaxID=99594 RepID=A0A419T472_9FIRM|nr:four helix bundle protein [Thermohalobacter berrensis]RKD32261.1 hypothetical protein BET03_02820 [Thermohalobacter berrensis]